MNGQGGPAPKAPRLTRRSAAPKVGQVHLGPGAFFRAFNAPFTDEAMAKENGDWGIVAVSLRSPTARDELLPQGGVFTSVTLGAKRTARIIGSVTNVLVAPEDPAEVLAALTDPGVRVVSLTITEKGYCHDPASGQLNPAHPDINYDLTHPDAPKSAIGFLVRALARRREMGTAPFTVLSCDNLPANGRLARGVVVEFAKIVDADLATWISSAVPFPATMVDRITPATTQADIEELARDQGYTDRGCVVHEAFRQWVIEDNFVNGRPAWDAVGAQMVGCVDAHELMKLRCLNGTHSTLAYLGYLSGYQTISDTVADPDFAHLCEILWSDEITPTVPQPEGEDLRAYCATLMERYRDPAIRHLTWQIAMDGSQKLPQRLLGTIADNLARGVVPRGLCLAVAAWMRYVGGVDEAGEVIDVRDPLSTRLKAASDSGADAKETVARLLEIRDVFDAELAANAEFQKVVTSAYADLVANGAKATVRAFVEDNG